MGCGFGCVVAVRLFGVVPFHCTEKAGKTKTAKQGLDHDLGTFYLLPFWTSDFISFL